MLMADLSDPWPQNHMLTDGWLGAFDDIYIVVMTPEYHSGYGLILGLCPTNERLRYFVTTSLIGWAQN